MEICGKSATFEEAKTVLVDSRRAGDESGCKQRRKKRFTGCGDCGMVWFDESRDHGSCSVGPVDGQKIRGRG